jgi:hypothetical protein
MATQSTHGTDSARQTQGEDAKGEEAKGEDAQGEEAKGDTVHEKKTLPDVIMVTQFRTITLDKPLPETIHVDDTKYTLSHAGINIFYYEVGSYESGFSLPIQLLVKAKLMHFGHAIAGVICDGKKYCLDSATKTSVEFDWSKPLPFDWTNELNTSLHKEYENLDTYLSKEWQMTDRTKRKVGLSYFCYVKSDRIENPTLKWNEKIQIIQQEKKDADTQESPGRTEIIQQAKVKSDEIMKCANCYSVFKEFVQLFLKRIRNKRSIQVLTHSETFDNEYMYYVSKSVRFNTDFKNVRVFGVYMNIHHGCFACVVDIVKNYSELQDVPVVIHVEKKDGEKPYLFHFDFDVYILKKRDEAKACIQYISSLRKMKSFMFYAHHDDDKTYFTVDVDYPGCSSEGPILLHAAKSLDISHYRDVLSILTYLRDRQKSIYAVKIVQNKETEATEPKSEPKPKKYKDKKGQDISGLSTICTLVISVEPTLKEEQEEQEKQKEHKRDPLPTTYYSFLVYIVNGKVIQKPLYKFDIGNTDTDKVSFDDLNDLVFTHPCILEFGLTGRQLNYLYNVNAFISQDKTDAFEVIRQQKNMVFEFNEGEYKEDELDIYDEGRNGDTILLLEDEYNGDDWKKRLFNTTVEHLKKQIAFMEDAPFSTFTPLQAITPVDTYTPKEVHIIFVEGLGCQFDTDSESFLEGVINTAKYEIHEKNKEDNVLFNTEKVSSKSSCNEHYIEQLKNVATTWMGFVPTKNRTYINDLYETILNLLYTPNNVILVMGFSYGGSVVSRIAELLTRNVNIPLDEETHKIRNLYMGTFGSIYVPKTTRTHKVHLLHYLQEGDIAMTCNRITRDKLLHVDEADSPSNPVAMSINNDHANVRYCLKIPRKHGSTSLSAIAKPLKDRLCFAMKLSVKVGPGDTGDRQQRWDIHLDYTHAYAQFIRIAISKAAIAAAFEMRTKTIRRSGGAKSTKSAKSAKSTEPTESTESARSSKSTKSAKPVKPTKSTKSAKPVNPARDPKRIPKSKKGKKGAPRISKVQKTYF